MLSSAVGRTNWITRERVVDTDTGPELLTEINYVTEPKRTSEHEPVADRKSGPSARGRKTLYNSTGINHFGRHGGTC